MHKLWAKSLKSLGKFEKSINVFVALFNLHAIWKSAVYRSSEINKVDFSCYEFSEDDFIDSKAALGHCYLEVKDNRSALTALDEARRKIEKSVMWNSELYVNVCNDMGNIYLGMKSPKKALAKFSASAREIEKEPSCAPPDVHYKLLSNIA